ncbi:carboxyl transferase domain-containing protein [Parafrankia sp. BMG5.11]|uniref:carboxyl transferase domain-containing protein n=1 Tax=Parafrankia sp. BMG5.11 TaxID=222540 RepID=UPI00103DF7B6|nr:carboxyl transferase domain-containing protein [Parafrankia sp. BMG5.11]TCJ37992.1 acetyl-CoA carboxylase subunit alpha/beta [Parafrankia sp. BMG5.11]
MAERDSTATARDWRAAVLADVIRRPAVAGAPNRLGWPGYDGRPALWWGTGPVEGVDAVVAVWDFAVNGGSFGEADAGAFADAAGAAVAGRLPLVSLVRSGGTRLQEGVAGLVGLARVSLALAEVAAAGLPHVAVSDQPTTGGMWVTVGSRADLRCAVLGATVGFAGPRVVAAVTGEAPPAGASHTAAAAHAAGLVDAAVAPAAVASWLRRALDAVAVPARVLPAARAPDRPARTDADGDRAGIADNSRADASRADASRAGSGPAPARGGWEQVLAARTGQRRHAGDILDGLFPAGVDLTGPDRTVRARVGRLAGTPVTDGEHSADGELSAGGEPGAGGLGPRAVGVALAVERGGAPGPAGYRLLVRAAGLASRLGLPLVTLVDTPGAECGPAAEAGGIAAEIGAAMAEVLGCASPTLSVIVGEGGSGGALAACCTDVVLMSPDSYVTALSPEGTATTLRISVEQAADTAGLRPSDLVSLGFADGVLTPRDTGPPGLAHRVTEVLTELTMRDSDVRLRQRRAKWSTGLGGFL